LEVTKKIKNQIAGILFIVFSIVTIGGIWIFNGYQNDGKTTPSNIPKLVEFADSIRNSMPDTALSNYNQVVLKLKNSKEGQSNSHMLALAYTGIAYIYAEKGESSLAMLNDSLAMEIALANDDKPIIANVLIIRGTILYRQGEYDKAMDCYQKAFDLAMETKDLELQAKIAANRAMIYSRQGDNQLTIEGFSQALAIGLQLKNDPLIAANYMNLGVVYMNLSKNDSAMIYSNLALELFKKTNDKNGQIKCYRNIGNVYYGLSDFGKTIQFYQLSLQLALEMNDQLNVAKSYNNLSEIYLHLGDHATATDLLFKSIKIKEQLDDKFSLAKGYTGVAKLYLAQKEYHKALIYFRKSLQISLNLNSVSEIGSNYNSIATVYCFINKADSAIVFYNKALELFKQIDYTYGIANIYINLGDEYRKKQDFAQAETLLLKALKSKTEIEEEEGVAVVNSMLASLYFTMANRKADNQSTYLLEKAEKAGLESFKTAKRLGSLPVMKDISSLLMEIYQKQGRFQEALKYSQTFNSLNDSILNEAKVEALTFAEARWNVENKQKEINNLEKTQLLDHEIIVQKETEAKQQIFIIEIMVAMFLLTIASITFIALYIRKRRDVMHQKQLSNIAILRMQNIRNVLSPHFIFNVLNNIWAIIDDRENARAQFDNLINLIRRSLINTEKLAIPLNDEIDFVKSFIELQKMGMDNNLQVIWNIDDRIDFAQPVPGMILQIPVENAIKHGLAPKKDKRLLQIELKTESGFLQFNISDNGLGLQHAPSPTKGTGTGLKVLTNTMHILNQNNDEKMTYQIVNRNDEEETGTKVIIKIPMQYNYDLY
jgi:tetratricopeptide (TPR) repeat protein